MKTTKIIALALLFSIADANAQTLTRTLLLQPATSTYATTIGLTGIPGANWSLLLPSDGNTAASGPFMKVGIAAGNKTVSFGQVSLTSNGASGDITGTLGVTNGGTGLATVPAGNILVVMVQVR